MADTIPELEQAWRNGWGSALNFLRAQETMVSEHTLMTEGERHVLLDMVAQWTEIVDSLTDQAVGMARDIGFAASPSNGDGS